MVLIEKPILIMRYVKQIFFNTTIHHFVHAICDIYVYKHAIVLRKFDHCFASFIMDYAIDLEISA